MSRCALVLAALAAGVMGCGAPAAQPPGSTPPAAVQAPIQAGTPAVPHGDHNPHHGGVVMMKGDMHYELVVDPSGRAQLFFTDAVREDLPASIASSASVTLQRPGAPDESIPLRIDESGESWVGIGQPITNRNKTSARVSFTIKGEPYSIDLPLAPGT
jgi:hypothetical protein